MKRWSLTAPHRNKPRHVLKATIRISVADLDPATDGRFYSIGFLLPVGIHLRGLAHPHGIPVVVILISLIGGQDHFKLPRNWLARGNARCLPVPFGPFDVIVVAINALVLPFWVI